MGYFWTSRCQPMVMEAFRRHFCSNLRAIKQYGSAKSFIFTIFILTEGTPKPPLHQLVRNSHSLPSSQMPLTDEIKAALTTILQPPTKSVSTLNTQVRRNVSLGVLDSPPLVHLPLRTGCFGTHVGLSPLLILSISSARLLVTVPPGSFDGGTSVGNTSVIFQLSMEGTGP